MQDTFTREQKEAVAVLVTINPGMEQICRFKVRSGAAGMVGAMTANTQGLP